MKRILYTILLAISLTATGADSLRTLRFSDIDGGKFRVRGITALRSMADGEHFTAITAEGQAIVKYRYADGAAVDTVINMRRVKPSFRISDYAFSKDEKLIMLPSQVDAIFRHSRLAYNWIYDCTTGKMTPLSSGGKQQAATFSPDGTKAAFVRERNLFVVDLPTLKEQKATIDGVDGEVINGVCDWVYEEEYGFERAYEWSGASDAIAYYRFDESRVKNYPMPVYGGKLYPDNVTFKYPKAGEDNSVVQIKVYRVATGESTSINIGDNADQYIPRIEWTGRSGELAVHRLNRLQNQYDLLFCDAMTGRSRTVYSESSPRYVERIDDSKINFLLESSRMIIKSEVGGYMHLYLYDMAGKFICNLSDDVGDVTDINAIDERRSRIYFTATETGSSLSRVLFVNSFTRGAEPRKLNSCVASDGFYGVDFSRGAKYYIQNFSSSGTPNIYTLHRTSDGKCLRTLEDNHALRDTVELYDMPIKEFFSFTTAEGVTLNGYILKPSSFDAAKKYPVFMTQYSGPGSQSVANKWGVSWEAALVADGYLVVCVDGRGTGFRGSDFKSCTYGRLGELETEDQISSAKYLATQPWVDGGRIGIYGWSYGGFMALNCMLKGADVFACGVAIAPVTSWRFYDTIYTELYNGLPADNAEGYDNNSPINYADLLRGKLLIAHGTADDNVHIQNTYEMISSLNRAGREYEALIFPDRNHSMGGDYSRLIHSVIDFVNENL